MSVNEKQFGVRLKNPALQVIERRTEEINNLAPETKITAGGVARHAVEEYARMLDRKDVEVHLTMPFVGLHTSRDYQEGLKKIEDHPFIKAEELKMDYDFDDLKELQAYFGGITKILKKYSYLSQRELQAWENISKDLAWNYRHISSGLEFAREQEELMEAQKAAEEAYYSQENKSGE